MGLGWAAGGRAGGELGVPLAGHPIAAFKRGSDPGAEERRHRGGAAAAQAHVVGSRSGPARRRWRRRCSRDRPSRARGARTPPRRRAARSRRRTSRRCAGRSRTKATPPTGELLPLRRSRRAEQEALAHDVEEAVVRDLSVQRRRLRAPPWSSIVSAPATSRHKSTEQEEQRKGVGL